MSRQVKGESDKFAQMVLIAAAGISVTIVGLVLIIFHKYQIAENTGTLGDTIGGIAGPILNFAGLYIIYLSLKEQFKANEIQRETNNLEVCLKLIDKLVNQAEIRDNEVGKIMTDFHNIKFSDNSENYSNFQTKINAVKYMKTMEPVLAMFGTIKQLIARSNFDRSQQQAIAFVLRYEFLPKLHYLTNILSIDSTNLGEDTVIYDTETIGRMLKRIRDSKTWILAIGALSDNALNEWLD